MAGFVFRLQPVLESRRRAEQDARRAVARLQRQRLDIEDGLRRHQRQITSGKDRMRGSMIGALILREKRYDQWKFAQHKAEITALDELTVAAAARKERDP